MIGKEMSYTDSVGKEFRGIVINQVPAVLLDVDTGERLAARRFVLLSPAGRTFTTPAMNAATLKEAR